MNMLVRFYSVSHIFQDCCGAGGWTNSSIILKCVSICLILTHIQGKKIIRWWLSKSLCNFNLLFSTMSHHNLHVI